MAFELLPKPLGRAQVAEPREASAVELDIVVTPVAGRFVIGRVNADHKTQSIIEVQGQLVTALQRACEVAGNRHRVFLAQSHRQTSTLVDCSELKALFPK
jgi:hypothetical protein